MRSAWIILATPAILLTFSAQRLPANPDENPKSAKAKPQAAGIAIWDTGKSADESLNSTVLLKKEGWTQIPVQSTKVALQGDAVLSNGRVFAVLRKQDGGVELYAESPDGNVQRTRLVLIGANGEAADHLDHVSIVENAKGAATLQAYYKTAKQGDLSAKFRLKKSEVALEITPAPGAERLRVDCPGRFAVLPDFFADDIVLDARKISPPVVEAPSENFLLHLSGKGDGITMCVFENRKQDVLLHLSGADQTRTVAASEMGFEDKKIWVALLEGPRVWHAREIQAGDTGNIVPLDWRMPFAAQWRVDFTRTNGLTDSWEMLLQKKEGGYVKPSWLGGGDQDLNSFRRRWNTVLGEFNYPCWSDLERNGFLQPLNNKALKFQGPAVIYPINRVKETPLETYTVVDVMRSTLGVGPCEHILDLEGQKAEYRGRATCSVRDTLGEIYGQNRQKKERAEVEKILDDGLIFVKHIRGRITRYVDFGHKMTGYLEDQRKARPELANALLELEKIVQEIDARVAARADKIQTPEHVARMNEEFRKNVLDDDGASALAKCKKYTAALVEIGDNQDELSAECRWVVKTLRQRAAILLAADPKLAEVAGEIRARTQEALRSPANHEGPRH
ncbi:MAG: hypothetical protein ACJ8FY_21890 [Gemmataceae bacterium]